MRANWRWQYVVAYALLAAIFLALLARFHDEETGFTSLITFGSRFEARRLPELAGLPLYTYADSDGYDGQFYSQIAVAGNPADPRLHSAVDSAPYRLRRILVPLVAHAAGFGDPQTVLQVFALFNVACWLLLAALLARWWFPPSDLHNLLRWGGTMFGHGVLASVRHSLNDLPALLLIAVAVRLLERHRPWAASVVLTAAGLARETSLLCAAALLPKNTDAVSSWPAAVARCAVVVLPIAVWTAILVAFFRATGSAGNFAAPFDAFTDRLFELAAAWQQQGWTPGTQHTLWALAAPLAQVGTIALRPRIDDPWWRIGAAHAVLWLFLGPAVWAGMAPAAARAVLPLTLAFNVLAPRTPAGTAMLLAGNLTVLSAAMTLTPPWGAR